jgi:soluble lytic murein transglycosylase
MAYEVAAQHAAESKAAIADAEFHAGWYALRFRNKPLFAKVHFERIAAIAETSRTRARAFYWLGRAHEALGDQLAAQLSYKVAARFGATFYGQLAREKAGLTTTGLEDHVEATARDRVTFAERETARVIERLIAAGHEERSFLFFKHLAETLESPGEVALTAQLARRIDKPRTAMTIGSLADARGLAVGALRAPLIGIPHAVPTPDPVDRALVYAISRQESAFNPEAVSPVGARGLMQLMPATAKATARSIGLPYAPARLTGDPAYNATLGAAHLAELMDGTRGSYILTFVGYNAGPSRAWRWVEAYGDPRGAQTDPVDWIERIPFDETRDYVQKVMENLQAYRSRLGYPLSISRDLARGAPRQTTSRLSKRPGT